MRATIKDVSAAAGVSVKTVSRVLNNERYVRTDTRRRVEDAIAALRFRPSLAARSLAGSRSYQIALIWDNPSPHYVFAVQEGVRARCDEEGVRMEVVEIKDHPWFVGVQFHPEYLSRVLDPSRPYLGFIAASAGMLEEITSQYQGGAANGLAAEGVANGVVNGEF